MVGVSVADVIGVEHRVWNEAENDEPSRVDVWNQSRQSTTHICETRQLDVAMSRRSAPVNSAQTCRLVTEHRRPNERRIIGVKTLPSTI